MKVQSETDRFYEQFFTKHPQWKTPYPNRDEVTRAAEILAVVSQIAMKHQTDDSASLRILDLGSGKGWLTYMLAPYGQVLGVEPVANVVEFARQTHPAIDFRVGTGRTLLDDGFANTYDLIVSSEVIEHVPREEQPDFLQIIFELLDERGHAVITTPRGEICDAWMKRMRHGAGTVQPLEEWLTVEQLSSLARRQGFIPQLHRCFHVYPRLIPLSTIERFILKVIAAMGFQDAVPVRATIYQLVWLQK